MSEKLKKTCGSGDAKRGFTLIELLISIFIFSIFLGVVISSYVSIVRGQKEANEVRRMYSEVRDFTDFFSREVRSGTIDYGCYQPGVNVSCSGGDVSANPGAAYSSQCKPVSSFSLANGRSKDLSLVGEDGMTKTVFHYDDSDPDAKKLQVVKYVKDAGGGFSPSPEFPDGKYKDLLGASVLVEDLQFVISPDVNPYLSDYYCRNQKQFQPKVTVFMRVGNARSSGPAFDLDYQTTVSSRVYSKL